MISHHHPLYFLPTISDAHRWIPNRSFFTKSTISIDVEKRPNASPPATPKSGQQFPPPSAHKLCSCGRRRFIESIGTAFYPISASMASDLHPDSTDMMNRIHPPRPDWYEEFYASVMDTAMNSYEAEIAGYKSQLFTNLRGKTGEVLEIGIGTGPNLKYYACDNGIRVLGVDPNKRMAKYAQAAAGAAGLPLTNFKFVQAVAEALPVADASFDAVIGTLVLCSVKDVDLTLKEVKRVLKPGGIYLFVEHVAARDGSILKSVQSVVDPLQQLVADGCHLTRNTGNNISKAGFQSIDINMGTSVAQNSSRGSFSSLSNRGCFMSKPVHPVCFPPGTPRKRSC